MTLNDYLAINVFHFLLVFARLSIVGDLDHAAARVRFATRGIRHDF